MSDWHWALIQTIAGGCTVLTIIVAYLLQQIKIVVTILTGTSFLIVTAVGFDKFNRSIKPGTIERKCKTHEWIPVIKELNGIKYNTEEKRCTVYMPGRYIFIDNDWKQVAEQEKK